jgi:hypothetical protein
VRRHPSALAAAAAVLALAISAAAAPAHASAPAHAWVPAHASAPGGARAATISAAASAWGKARQVPGLAALAGAGDSALTSVSCGSPGNCSAGGFYQLGSHAGQSEAFVVSQVNGTWGRAESVPGIVSLNKNGQAGITSVSCASAGNCSAGGYYTSGFYPGGHAAKTSAFVVSQVHGVWGIAREVPGIAALDTGGQAGVASVSCASPGNCSAGGFFDILSGPGCCKSQGFVVSQVQGVWGKARRVPGTAAIDAVSCARPGDCGAAGVLVLSQVNGVWGAAQKVATPKGSTFGAARITVISCSAQGDCTAGGIGGKQARALVVSQAGGAWGVAHEIAGTATLMAKSKSSLLASVSCTSPGTCTGGGYAFRSMPEGSSTREFAVPYVVRQRAGAWGHAQVVPGITTLSKHGYAIVTAVACTSGGDCAAAGRYSTSSYNPDGSGPGEVFVTSETNGRWGSPSDVTASLGNDGPASMAAIACPGAGKCSAGGAYWLKDQERAFVISEAGAQGALTPDSAAADLLAATPK